MAELLEVGDIVTLGPGTPAEFAGHCGIVTSTAQSHVTVAVLDESESEGLGECWPSFGDVTLVHQDWRLGRQVVIDGFHGEHTRRLNGCTGSIARHPRSGHPSFVCKPQNPNEPRLTFCVRLDKPEVNGGKRSVVVEPRYLRPYGNFVRQVSERAEKAAAAV